MRYWNVSDLTALEAGEKVTMTELVVKYLRVGMGLFDTFRQSERRG
jgi:hypothetical protein